MKVLVLGGGGREHALAWALRRSAAVSEVYCAPGNAGIEGAATCLPLSPNKPAEILRFLNEKEIGLTVIGPEAPLVDGLADALRAGGRLVFRPNAAAARLEGSKILAKEFMRAHGLPTADFRVFVNAGDALSFVRSAEWKDTFRVGKADGLAAGKGVVVTGGNYTQGLICDGVAHPWTITDVWANFGSGPMGGMPATWKGGRATANVNAGVSTGECQMGEECQGIGADVTRVIQIR